MNLTSMKKKMLGLYYTPVYFLCAADVIFSVQKQNDCE